MRIGLLGGSFDPVHEGHLAMAKHAYHQLQLDEVWFIPAYDAPLKDRKLTSFAHRCKMLELSIAAYKHFKICTIEKKWKQKSYTINTVRELLKCYPDDIFYFIMGQDQVAQLDKWKDIDILQDMVQLCAFERNGNVVDTPYRVRKLHMESHLVSSSDIRLGKRNLLSKAVLAYINEHGLYFDFIKQVMSEKRYAHSLSVATLCKDIAKVHHLDEKKAYLSGLLHDIMKEYRMMNQEAAKTVLKIMKPELLEYKEAIWHGYLGSFVCKHMLHIYDRDILMAIENHVLGDCLNPYAMILYAADKLDPLRGYDSSETIALIKKDLYKGFYEVHKQQSAYLGKENVSGIKR